MIHHDKNSHGEVDVSYTSHPCSSVPAPAVVAVIDTNWTKKQTVMIVTPDCQDDDIPTNHKHIMFPFAHGVVNRNNTRVIQVCDKEEVESRIVSNPSSSCTNHAMTTTTFDLVEYHANTTTFTKRATRTPITKQNYESPCNQPQFEVLLQSNAIVNCIIVPTKDSYDNQSISVPTLIQENQSLKLCNLYTTTTAPFNPWMGCTI
jgi:hypothetical protein